MQERLCKILPTPLTSVVIEDITELPADLEAPAPMERQAMPAIEGFTPLVLVLPVVVELSPEFI